MKPCLTHIALHVRDLAASVAFYHRWCELNVIHEREGVVWLAEAGREAEFILVMIDGGPRRTPTERDYSHIGFALDSRAAVDAIAAAADKAGVLAWSPADEPYPTGYYCGLRDPDGHLVEFSYGQPLGPGAEPINR